MEIVQDKRFFHLQRMENCPYNWHAGEQFFIGETNNPFFDWYDRHGSYPKTKDGSPYPIPTNRIAKHILAVLDEGADEDPDCKRSIGYDPIIVARMATEALQEYLMLVRELVYEAVRQKHFPDRPSRQRCIWVIDDEGSKEYWRGQLKGKLRLVEVELTGKIHRTNDDFLVADSIPLVEYHQYAFQYWVGIQGASSAKDELLFEGFVKVLSAHDDGDKAIESTDLAKEGPCLPK